MKKKIFSQVMSFCLILQFIAPPAMAASSCVSSVEQLLASEMSKQTETRLEPALQNEPSRLRRSLNFAGRYLIPVVPVWEALKDADRRFFNIEQTGMGVVTTPVSVAVGRLLSGADVFGGGYVRNVLEIFFSYQTTDFIRNSVGTDKKISESTRSWLNWYYSVLVYSAFTAGDHLAKAETPAQAAFAYGLVTYAGLWPIFSQRVKQYVIIPIMFGKFPKKTLLDHIMKGTKTKSGLLAEQELKLSKLETELGVLQSNPETPSKVLRAKGREIDSVKHDIDWIQKLRNGIEDGKPVSKVTRALYATRKTLVSGFIAVIMTAIYLSARNWLVGEGPEADAYITDMFKYFLHSIDPLAGSPVQEILDSVPGQVRDLIDQANQAPPEIK